jgi:hypothetical protein
VIRATMPADEDDRATVESHGVRLGIGALKITVAIAEDGKGSVRNGGGDGQTFSREVGFGDEGGLMPLAGSGGVAIGHVRLCVVHANLATDRVMDVPFACVDGARSKIIRKKHGVGGLYLRHSKTSQE